MKSLSVLLLLAAPAAGLLPFNTTAVAESPCWDVRHGIYYSGTVDLEAKRECESIAGCTFLEDTWLRCAPTEFMETIEPGACSNFVVEQQLYYYYWRSQSQGRGSKAFSDGCEWANCLKNREALCPQQVPDWENPLGDDRKCAWHNGKCQWSSLTDDLIDEKADLLEEVVHSDAVALHRCTVDAMRENGLTAGRSDFGCGPSVLSPDCLTQVTAMGNHAVSCAKETLRSSVEEYYDVNLRWEVESTKELYDCVSEGVQQCPFSQREFCSSVRHPQDWEIPSIADARACVADFNCMVPHYNECARKAEFVIEKALPVVRLSTGYQRAVNTQACLQRAVTTCGSSLQDVIDACLEFTNVEACGANLRCYIAELGACGVENNLWDQDTADDMRRVGPTITGNAKCFARELQGCGFHERGGFCSNGRMRDFADVGACLADFACMAKAIAPCQAGQELLFVAAREVGGRGCRDVDEACEAYCSEHVTSSPHNKDKCILYCRMDGYMQCTLLQRRNTYMTWRYRYVNGSGTYTHEAVVSDEAKQIACFEQSAPACGFDEDTFCEMAGAVPTDAEAEACTVQTKCAAKTLWTCLDRSRSSVVRALDKMADAAVTTYDKYPGLARATRACIEDKEALCGTKMSSLGYNTALCLADRTACEERARCITREAHACGVQSGLLQSATQDLMDSTGYTRCMLAAPAFQGVDLAQKIADLDYDFFFSPSQNLMRAHAKCAGWPLSKLTTILPSFAADPARRQIGSAQFCARSLASICEPFGFDAAAAAACALLATYRCRDGSEFNRKVDGCFADAAGECGAVKGLKTWANVQGVDCVNDVVKCAEMAVCLTAKTSTCLGTFLGGQAYGKLEQASSWTTDITEKYLGWGKKASVPSGGGGSTGGDGGSTAGDGSSTGGDGDSTGGDGGSTGGDGGSAGGDGGSTGGDGGSAGGDGGSAGGDGGSTGGDGGSAGGDGGSTGGDGGSAGGDGGSAGGDGGSTGGDGGSAGGDGGSAGGDGGSTGGDGGSTGGDGGSAGDTPLSGGSGDGGSGSTTSSGGSDGGSAAAADIGSGSMGGSMGGSTSGSTSGSMSGSTSGSGSGSGDGNAHKNAAPSEDKSSSTNLWIVVAAAGGGAIVAALVAVLIVKARAKKAAPQWDTTMCTEEINVRDYEIPMIEEADTLDAQASTHVETDRLTVAAVAE
eukprot:Rhum_TRINITY_DN15451_c0_g1::Rhum_TRINITY_DN15451_c0_g1_i5::g.160129::m.160129